MQQDIEHRDADFDLATIDIRSLSTEEWIALKRQIIRRAHSERDKAIGMAIGGALAWVWRSCRRLPKWSALRAAWISHVRKRREQVAAAQLRGLNDQWLADMGLTRGDIESRVRFRARRVS
jgi:uncharacterized protein YjiS (DUF1127 family)